MDGIGTGWLGPGGETPDPCALPAEGCPCNEAGAEIECGTERSRTGDQVSCAMGTRICDGEAWGACSNDYLAFQSIATHAAIARQRTQGFAPAAESCGDPCDPYCRELNDTPDDLELGPELDVSDAGVTLVQGDHSGNCAAFTLSPATATITVTSINANGTLNASPSQSRTYTATCTASGVPITPSWTLDSYDRAVVDGGGKVTVFSGTAGDVLITGSNSTTSALATLKVVVKMEDRGSSAAVATAFDTNTGSADPGKTLYPYKNTVFPLDLQAPLVQWNTGGSTATDVQVSLRYPAASASPTFLYSKIFNGSEPKQGTLDATVPAWKPPQEVWTAFGRTAARGTTPATRTGEIVIQRRYSSTVRAEMVIPVTFATEPLRGTVYYTQYLRSLFTPSSGSSICSGQTDLNPSTYTPGFVCPVGNCTHPGTSGTSTTRAIDLSSPTAPNTDPFNGTAGCPVCHSVSADGTTYVSGNQYWQVTGGGTSRGINSIGLSGTGAPTFTPRRGAPNYQGSGNDFDINWPSEQSRGFSYSAISPDGALVIQNASFWGNTANTPASNNVQDATLKGVTSNVKPSFFVATAKPGLGVQFATTAALPANTLSSGTLNASANGALTIDGVAMATGYSVLVKNEASLPKNGVYTVTNAGSGSSRWQLTRRNDADATGDILTDMDVRVSDGSATNRGKVFYVTTAGTITINSTSIQFAARTVPTLPSMMVPVFSPDGTKVAYVNADKDTIAGYPDTGWRRGLSMFSFDRASMTISNRKRLLNTWSSGSTGTPMKWPFFESDSRSLVYVETDPAEYCASNSPGTGSAIARACHEAAYGSMSPTTRGYWPGKVYSIDTQSPAATRVQLTKLTNGEDTADAAKSYQPSVLPFAVGGYRWAIFTSPRAYGNQLNARASAGSSSTGTVTDFTCGASMMWVAAITDTTANGTDRSHPAFFLPGQNVASITTQNHYVNERGYLVKSPCKNAGDSCTLTSECCGAAAMPTPTAACRVPSGWTPAAGAPQRTCADLSGTCSNTGQSCDSSADCCGNAICVNFACSSPPSYEEASFTRDYHAECGEGEQPVWGSFSYHLSTPSDTRIEFTAQTARTAAELDTADIVVLGSSTSTVHSPAAPEAKNVGAALAASPEAESFEHLRITITLVQSSDGLAAPVLEDWQMNYRCVPKE